MYTYRNSKAVQKSIYRLLICREFKSRYTAINSRSISAFRFLKSVLIVVLVVLIFVLILLVLFVLVLIVLILLVLVVLHKKSPRFPQVLSVKTG